MLVENIVRTSAAKAELVGVRFDDANRRQSADRRALVFFHGLGLDCWAPLYRGLARGLAKYVTVYLPALRASSFINYNTGFRRPMGWAYQRHAHSVSDSATWLRWITGQGHDQIVVGGHSWGALIALAADRSVGKSQSALLLSPLVSTWDILRTNFAANPQDAESLLARLQARGEQELIPTNAGAPLPYLSAGTIRDLVEHPIDLAQLLEGRTERVLTIMGELEHPVLRSRLEDLVSTLPSGRLVRLAKQGHFYASGLDTLVAAVADWLKDGQ